ncbi:MAG: type II toxin-antitoxin system CcdA family antitoxin [Streptomyces sp.]|jgi:hypothetical protein|nr:type II toxin-antitoxin system CcdA family antitoxin [Streptomyces sp.]
MTTPNTSGGTTRERTTITMEGDLLRRAKLAGGGNLSAYVEKAVRESLINDAMAAVTRLKAVDPMDDVIEAGEMDTEAAA